MSAFLIISAIQGIVITVDEFYFHHRRGLPRWERLGHPIDTATVIACLMFLYFTEPTAANATIYYVMALASCLCVTKDEWVHWKFCGPTEMWLHALLFVLHPLVLFSAMAEWQTGRSEFLMVGGAVFAFFIYQVIFWNFLESYLRKAKQAAHYRRLTEEELYEYFGE